MDGSGSPVTTPKGQGGRANKEDKNAGRPMNLHPLKSSLPIAAAAAVMGVGVRLADCDSSRLGYYCCSGFFLVAMSCILRVLKQGGLVALGWASAITSTTTDDAVVAVLWQELCSGVELEVFVALEVTIDFDDLRGDRVANWLQVVAGAALSYRVMLIFNHLAGLALESIPEGGYSVNKRVVVTVVDTVWILVAGMVISENAGLKLSSLMTSLGVGSIVAAMSARTVFEDLFASLYIFVDAPFKIGDSITAKLSGTVESIGLKTTHLRDFDGQKLVLPNRDICNTIIHNNSDVPFRRRIQQLELSPSTKVSCLESFKEKVFVAAIARASEKLPEWEVYDVFCNVMGFSEWGISVEVAYKVRGNILVRQLKEFNSEVYIAMLRLMELNGIELSSIHRLRALESASVE